MAVLVVANAQGWQQYATVKHIDNIRGMLHAAAARLSSTGTYQPKSFRYTNTLMTTWYPAQGLTRGLRRTGCDRLPPPSPNNDYPLPWMA
jgi:hypothetical protein